MLMKKSMLSSRAYDVCHADIHNKKYDELGKKGLVVEDKLSKLVPEDKQDELRDIRNEMFNIEVERSNIELKETYKQGFMDGLEIALLLLKQKK